MLSASTGELTVRALAAPLALLLATAAGSAWAQDDLEQRVRALEEQLAKSTPPAAAASAGDKGFAIRSADGNFEFRLRGLMQADGRFFAGDEQSFNDTFLLRRLEPAFEFTLGSLVYLKVQPQFAGDSATTSDIFGELCFDPRATLRFGKFKTPLALEYLQGSGALAFIERGLPAELGAGRDFGVQLQGDLFGGAASYALAWLNGAPDGRDAASSDVDNKKEVAARLFFEPFRAGDGALRGLGFGVAGTTGSKFTTAGDAFPASLGGNAASFNAALPRYRSPGQNTVFSYWLESQTLGEGVLDTVVASGRHTRLSPQLYFYRGGLGLLAEYITSEQDVARNGAEATLEHQAWQAVVGFVLTGEEASYKGVTPASPYAAGGGWGAFEIAVRYGVADFDDDAFPVYADPDRSVTELADTGVALSWYLTANARLALNYDVTRFDGGAAAGADRDDEKALFTRVQLSF